MGALPWPMPPHSEFSCLTKTEDREICLTGVFASPENAKEVVVVVHGLGGGANSPYCRAAMSKFWRRGVASLSMSLRGADRLGEDFYHAGLCEDLAVVLSHAKIRAFDRVYVLGFSVGGHIALRLATQNNAPSFDALAAVCPPLDLAACSAWMDAKRQKFYRRRVLQGLVEIYTAVAERREVPTPLDVVQAVETFRGWDDMTVVPRFGFDSPDDYYQQMSVGRKLADVQYPAMIIGTRADPMVPPFVLEPFLAEASDNVAWRMLKTGGHLGFPMRTDLGIAGSLGLIDQLLSWFRDPRP